MANANSLGEYIRARRAQISPEDVGLAPGSRRRVTGLRREELALLAGISGAYLQRLEQGRDRHPSPEVLRAIATALRMDANATVYLHELATRRSRPRPSSAPEQVPRNLAELVAVLPFPAVLVNRYQDVLATNAIAVAVSPGFAMGVNTCRWRFTDPAAHRVYVNWHEATAISVGGLRESSALDPDDPRMRSLITELCSVSDRFSELWDRGDVGHRAGVTAFRHPRVGTFELVRSKLSVPHSGGQYLLTFHPEPGSASATILMQLSAHPEVASALR